MAEVVHFDCQHCGAPNGIDARQTLVCEVCGESDGGCAPHSDEREMTTAALILIKFQCKCCCSQNAICHGAPLVCEICGSEAGSALENEAVKPHKRVRLKAMRDLMAPPAAGCNLEPESTFLEKPSGRNSRAEEGALSQGTGKDAQTNDGDTRALGSAGEEGGKHTATVSATLYTFSTVLLESVCVCMCISACALLPLFNCLLILGMVGGVLIATDAIATGLMREDVYDYDLPAFESSFYHIFGTVTSPAVAIVGLTGLFLSIVIGSSAHMALAYSRQVFISKLRNRTQPGLAQERAQ